MMVTLAKFYRLEDADLLKCRLEAYGVPAFLLNDAMAQMNWFYTNAIGGIGVQVADEDYETAREILDSEPAPPSESAAEPEVVDPVVPVSDSFLFRAAQVMFFIFVLLCFALGILTF